MKTKFDTLRREIEQLKNTLRQKETELDYAVRTCIHCFGEAVADHQYTPGFTIPGDAPGTMGVDWRGDVYVPSSEKKQWKRTCKTCGKVETTTSVNRETIVKETPRF